MERDPPTETRRSRALRTLRIPWCLTPHTMLPIVSVTVTASRAAVSIRWLPTQYHRLTQTFPVFANLYYEFNNELLDFVFSEHSNLKCALYGDVHTAVEKTNFGGQQSYPSPGPLTYIQDSTGWAAVSLLDPPAPTGYSLVYGPTGGANNAPGVRNNSKPPMSRLLTASSVHGFRIPR